MSCAGCQNLFSIFFKPSFRDFGTEVNLLKSITSARFKTHKELVITLSQRAIDASIFLRTNDYQRTNWNESLCKGMIFVGRGHAPLKRWAVVGCPSGTGCAKPGQKLRQKALSNFGLFSAKFLTKAPNASKALAKPSLSPLLFAEAVEGGGAGRVTERDGRGAVSEDEGL